MENTRIKLLCLFLLTSSLLSCNEDFRCRCTSDVDGSLIEESKYNLSKKDATSSCSNQDNKPNQTCVLLPD